MQTKTLEIQIDQANALIIRSKKGDDLLISKTPWFFLPELDGVAATPIACQITQVQDSLTISYTLPEDSPVQQVFFEMRACETHVELRCRFGVRRDCVLGKLDIFPSGCLVNLYKLFNFRNRHCTEQTAPELLLGESFVTTTYSSDWQFAPHPSMFTFTKNACNLFIGAMDLPQGTFGLDIAVDNYRIMQFSQNYGGFEHGLQLMAGEVFCSGRFALFAGYEQDPHETIAQYCSILVEEKIIPDPSEKKRFDWHRSNLYCTWVDQGYLTEASIPKGLHDQIEITASAADALNDELMERALNVIEEQKLDFSTILIDMGWSTRGEWIAKKEQFADLRGLIDRLHARGYRVVAWWNWAEVDNLAEIPARFLAGGGWINKHGQRTIDFSSPVTQEEYLKPLFHRLFSSDPGCYDFDGVKTDFLSDKIHPETPLFDSSWRGEENYFYRVFELFFNLMRKHKPDAVHIGCAGHPHLVQFIDINRTYDVWSTNVLEHVNRGKMLAATSVGCPVAYDFHHFEENLEEYFLAALENGCSVQIGSVLGLKRYPLSGWKAADDAYYALLRKYLKLLPGGR
jgi:hypothetical protein